MAEERTDIVGLRNAPGMLLGDTVRMQGIRPELLLGLIVLSELCRATGVIIMVTHILDGEHMHNSLHYTGAAVDFVLALRDGRTPWVDELKSRLGETYDVIDEGTHIHVEYQPHHGATT